MFICEQEIASVKQQIVEITSTINRMDAGIIRYVDATFKSSQEQVEELQRQRSSLRAEKAQLQGQLKELYACYAKVLSNKQGQ